MNDTHKTAAAKSNKIEVVSLTSTGIILKNNRKEKIPILFSNIQKTYIQKHKLSFLKKMGIVSLFFTVMAFSSLYLPTELTLAFLILVVPLIVKINVYKWYALNILLSDGTLIKKIFFLQKKQEYVHLVQTIKKEVYYSQINCQTQLKGPLEQTAVAENSAFQTLNIV